MVNRKNGVACANYDVLVSLVQIMMCINFDVSHSSSFNSKGIVSPCPSLKFKGIVPPHLGVSRFSKAT